MKLKSCERKRTCPHCGRDITVINFTKHLRRHDKHPETFKPPYKIEHEDLTCKYCGKPCKNKNALIQHEKRCANNPQRILTGFAKVGQPSWNKGLTKETDERVKRHGEAISKTLKGRPGRKHTEEWKRWMSEHRKNYLKEHPDKVPYLLNHSSQQSYPEKYFQELFIQENLDLDYHIQFSRYQADFCNIGKKLDIEIDGDQHILDKKTVQIDIERDKYFKQLGFTIYRILWSDYQKKTSEEKHLIVDEIRKLLR